MEQAHYRHRRKAHVVGFLILALYSVLDIVRPAGPRAWVARLVWMLAIAISASVQCPGSPRRANALARIVGVVSGVCATAIVAAHGGSKGVYFGFLLCTPFCVLVLVPDLPSSAALAGVTTTIGGILLLIVEGRRTATIVEWTALVVTLNLLAGYSTQLYDHFRRAEKAALLGRARAMADLRASEERLGKSQRLAALGTLAAGVAHEINNPLAYVKANLCWLRDALQDGCADAAELTRVLDETERGADRIARIVAELSTYSRIREDPAPTDVGRVVDEAVRTVAQRIAASCDLGVDVAPDLPRVDAVGRHLSQAIVNLLVNAVEAIESRAARDRDAPRRLAVRVAREASFVTVSVDDSGDGLRDDAAAHLFEPFFTTKGPLGTGLGLAISRENLSRFGASIEAGRSALGGARFTVRLSCAGDVSPA